MLFVIASYELRQVNHTQCALNGLYFNPVSVVCEFCVKMHFSQIIPQSFMDEYQLLIRDCDRHWYHSTGVEPTSSSGFFGGGRSSTPFSFSSCS